MPRFYRNRCRVTTGSLLILLLGVFWHAPAEAFDSEMFFQQNCSACHTIGGGRRIGPDLAGVTQRQDREWLVNFMLNPEQVINSGDPYARQLLKEANGVIMYPVAGLNRERANAILDWIEQQNMQPSEVAATGPVDTTSVKPDPLMGYQIFKGAVDIQGGAPPCISCHTGRGPLIGGSLGPDLSNIFQRLGGRAGLSAWLASPPTPAMRSVFANRPLTQNEVTTLVDLFESWSTMNRSFNHDSYMVSMTTIFCGGGGAVIVLMFFAAIWRNRFRSERRALINFIKGRR